jgi:hypothetical protein
MLTSFGSCCVAPLGVDHRSPFRTFSSLIHTLSLSCRCMVWVSQNGRINWSEVFLRLDQPSLQLPDADAYRLLSNAHQLALGGAPLSLTLAQVKDDDGNGRTAGRGGDGNEGSNGGSGVVDDIEAEANGYFQKIYTQHLSLSDAIAMLQQFKSSEVKRERDVFACMVHNLFDEYRFFHKVSFLLYICSTCLFDCSCPVFW